MLYFVVEKSNLDYFKEFKYTILPTSLLKPSYVFVYSSADILKIKLMIIRNKVSAIFIQPYLSEEKFKVIYGVNKWNKLSQVYLERSLFEILMSNHLNIVPSFNTDFYLLSDMENTSTYLLVDSLNEYLVEQGLLLSESSIMRNLRSMLAESIEETIKAEIGIHDIRELSHIQEQFFINTFEKFLSKSKSVSSLQEVRDFIKREFQIE